MYGLTKAKILQKQPYEAYASPSLKVSERYYNPGLRMTGLDGERLAHLALALAAYILTRTSRGGSCSMNINWVNFTPWASLAGGALIGLAASLFILANGRIAGISGLLGSLIQGDGEGRSEKALFLLGLVLAPVLWGLFSVLPKVEVHAGWPALVIAGLLVGVGTRYAAGCTSGHGVCGVSRLSPRSMLATLCFMATGFATVYVIRHLLGA